MPTYNRAHLIGHAIASVLAQTHDRRDIVVVDDGSTDNTREVVGDFVLSHPEITYIYQANSGLPAVARNTGIAHASGEFVAFLDSDDEWLPHKLAEQIAAIENKPDVALVCSDALYYDDARADTGKRHWHRQIPPSGNVFGPLFLNNFVATSTAMVRTECLRTLGHFNPSHSIRFCEDYDLWLRVAANYRVICLPNRLARYRIWTPGAERDPVDELTALSNVLLTTVAQYPALVGQLGWCGRARVAGVYRELARQTFKTNRFHDTSRYCRAALHWHPWQVECYALALLCRCTFLSPSKLAWLRCRVLRRQALNVPKCAPPDLPHA